MAEAESKPGLLLRLKDSAEEIRRQQEIFGVTANTPPDDNE